MRRFIPPTALAVCLLVVSMHAADTKQCKADPRGNAFGYWNTCGAAAAIIGVDGGTVATPTGASVTLPFGAVDQPTSISIHTSATGAPRSVGAVSPVYEFGPQAKVFGRPVTVSLPLPAGVSRASIYFSKLGSTTEFEPIGGTIANGVITAQTPHFSLAVIGVPSATRTVNGLATTTWISATNREIIPQDFAATPAEALVLDGAGNLVSIPAIPGSGAALGTFTIEGVPNGEYVLHSGNRYLVTATNAPDLGASRGGRSTITALADRSAKIGLHLTLAPWHAGGLLELFSTEADDWDFGTDRFVTLADGQTDLAFTFDLRDAAGGNQVSLIEGSRGDRLYFAQLAPGTTSAGVPYMAMSRLAQLPSFDTLVGGQVTLPPTVLSDVQQMNSIEADFRGSEFKAALTAGANPATAFDCGACVGTFAVLGQGGRAEDGFYTSNADLLAMSDPSGTDIASGIMHYGSPANAGLGGEWGELALAQWSGFVRYQLPGKQPTSRGLPSGISMTAPPAAFAAPRQLRPTMSFVRNFRIDGRNGFDDQSLTSLTPTLSWTPPAIGTPTFYSVRVFEVYADANLLRTQTKLAASISTPGTSVKLFPGILQSGHTYAIEMVAADAPEQANAPFRIVLNSATAFTPSGLLTAP